MEIGNALLKIDVPITYVVHSNKLLSQIIDKKASEIIEKKLLRLKVKILKGENIKEIEEKNNITYAKLESGKVLKGSCVIFGKGVKPNIDFLKSSKIKINEGIIVNKHLETNIKDVYAAGDVVETRDIVYNDRRMHALWPIAVEQGKIAGLNMTGVKISYEGNVSRNILTVFGTTIFTGGISKEDKLDVYKKTTNGEYSKIILKEGKLKGFLFTGEVNSPGVYLHTMKNEIEVGKLKNPLLYGTISYSSLCSSIRKRMF
jgi:NAD(P)H-nitrite reductase large subunit